MALRDESFRTKFSVIEAFCSDIVCTSGNRKHFDGDSCNRFNNIKKFFEKW